MKVGESSITTTTTSACTSLIQLRLNSELLTLLTIRTKTNHTQNYSLPVIAGRLALSMTGTPVEARVRTDVYTYLHTYLPTDLPTVALMLRAITYFEQILKQKAQSLSGFRSSHECLKTLWEFSSRAHVHGKQLGGPHPTKSLLL